MKKYILLLLFTFSIFAVSAQNKSGEAKKIKGEIMGKPMVADTIYFVKQGIADKYYENNLDSAAITANGYRLKNTLTHPQMYRIWFASDRNKLAWREGLYFIDPATTSIKTDYSADNCSIANGPTAAEYRLKFAPFMTNSEAYDCKSTALANLLYSREAKADSLMLKYVALHPNSYVALWELVNRFSMWGQSSVRLKTLNQFSAKIKGERTWKILSADFTHARIRENEKFPDIKVKNLELAYTKLVFPKAKYTLVDYWFCRCRPCLDAVPALKKLYADYKSKGFEMVSISVDETVNVPLWQKRVKEYGLTWTQYLEENNFRVNELGINSFPTFLLLDSEGKVVWRNFELDDLEKFLEKNT